MKVIKGNDKNLNNFLNKNTCFVGIFSKFCIHCKNMKPQWESMKKKLKKIDCNAIIIELSIDDHKNINNSELSQYMLVNGVPSMMIMKNGKINKHYNGNRSENDMSNFVLKNINKRKLREKTKKIRYYKQVRTMGRKKL